MMASRLSKTPFLQAKRQLAQAAVAAKPTDLGGSAQVCRFKIGRAIEFGGIQILKGVSDPTTF